MEWFIPSEDKYEILPSEGDEVAIIAFLRLHYPHLRVVGQFSTLYQAWLTRDFLRDEDLKLLASVLKDRS